MSQQSKPQGDNKPQPPAEQKPTPSQGSSDFTTRRVMVGDSAENIRKKSK